jgi:hypothetical protein
MADKRINDYPVATSIAEDDYILMESPQRGSYRILASELSGGGSGGGAGGDLASGYNINFEFPDLFTVSKQSDMNGEYDITGDTNVKQKIDELRADLTTETNEREANDQFLSGSIDSVSAITDANIKRIDNTIGTGFTDDSHTNITAKFEELRSDLTNEITRAESEEQRIEEKLDNEISRSINKDNVIYARVSNTKQFNDL